MSKANFRGRATGLLSASAILLAPAFSQASSFYILEQSPAHLGHAFSGTASNISDASTVFFNPAGMSQLDQSQISAGANIIMPRATFNDTGSSTGGMRGRTDEVGFVPNLYYTSTLNEQWSYGIGINAPFGLVSDYGDQWAGRYLATRSELEVININANTAFALNDQLSVGLGLNYQHMDVTLENQVDSTLGVNPQPETDSSGAITGDDDDITFDLSAYYQLNNRTSAGIIWRQGGDFSLDGEANFELNDACTPGAGFPTGEPAAPTTGTMCAGLLGPLEGNVIASVSLPDTFTASLSHELNDEWTLHGDIAWTEWSSIQSIEVVNTGNGATVDTLELDYSDTMRYAFGATYSTGNAWSWRMGIAFDEAPQTNPEQMNPRIPDEDRTWLSAGFNYEFSPQMSFDLGYTHIFVEDASLVNDDPQMGHSVRGDFDSKVDILSAQVNWRF